MTEDYKLPPEVHDAICEEIKKGLFDGKEPVSNPQIFILGGQPGAGKSVLTKRVYENFGSSNIVTINGDEFRLNHPQAPEIFAKHNKDFAAYTDADVRAWGKSVFDAAIAGHYNIIFEGTMRTTQICDTIKNLRAEGYKINILALAVPEIESRISIYARYQEQLDRYPLARFTSRSAHDAAYQGMLGTLQKIEDEKLYDTMMIYNRAGEVVFKTGDKGVVKAITDEREKPMSHENVRRYGELCDVLLDKMRGRGEEEKYIADLAGLRHQLMRNEVNQYMSFIQNMRHKVAACKNSQVQDNIKDTPVSRGETIIRKNNQNTL